MDSRVTLPSRSPSPIELPSIMVGWLEILGSGQLVFGIERCHAPIREAFQCSLDGGRKLRDRVAVICIRSVFQELQSGSHVMLLNEGYAWIDAADKLRDPAQRLASGCCLLNYGNSRSVVIGQFRRTDEWDFGTNFTSSECDLGVICRNHDMSE